MLSPVEMRLQKKWKRRWAAEPGVWAVLFVLFPPSLFRDASVPGRCPGFIACCPSQGFPDERKTIPSGQDACCAVVLTLCGLDRPSSGALSPEGRDRDRFWVFFCWIQLQYRVFPQFFMFWVLLLFPGLHLLLSML